jgi:putative component of membrane protein insertase Oxa1/YidC/SpoIIIJ protein YidD
MYYPTCSDVIRESLENKGLIGSIPTILKRVAICNPIYQKFGKNWQY